MDNYQNDINEELKSVINKINCIVKDTKEQNNVFVILNNYIQKQMENESIINEEMRLNLHSKQEKFLKLYNSNIVSVFN